MTVWQVARHRVAMAGRVSDAETGKPIGEVEVVMLDMPPDFRKTIERRAVQYGNGWNSSMERWDRTRTRPDGLFYFMDLPAGEYTVSALLPRSGKRYGAGQQTASLSRDANGNLARVFVNLALRPTTVKGKVTGPGRETGIPMAEIRVKGSSEQTFSDAQGEYVLGGLEPGKRTILVLAQGFQPASQVSMLREPGSVENLNFALEKESGSTNFAQSGTSKARSSGARTKSG